MSLQNDIYNKIKKSIIYGELSPGEKLSEVELANNLNSSRTPIREAFRQLQMEGYIIASPNKGAYVSKLPAEEIESIYDVISLLEGYAAGRASTKIQNEELNNLIKLNRKLFSFASKKKYRDYIELNSEFHRLITEISCNPVLTRTITELRSRVYRYRLTSVTIPGYLKKYVSHHEKIINALKSNDPARARQYMENHVNFVKEILVNFLRENPGY